MIGAGPHRLDRMTGAQFATIRHLIGLTSDEMATVLRVTPRTVRAWESDGEPIPLRVPTEIAALIHEHRDLTDQYATAIAVELPRDKNSYIDRPRGWHIAAAARALETQPHLLITWC